MGSFGPPCFDRSPAPLVAVHRAHDLGFGSLMDTNHIDLFLGGCDGDLTQGLPQFVCSEVMEGQDQGLASEFMQGLAIHECSYGTRGVLDSGLRAL